jgi:SPP1 gp7 family putative phage head morphogenesis protein
MAIQAPSPTTLDPVRPNAGIQAAYRKRLDAMVKEMHESILYWLTSAYKANEPEMAQDESPAAALRQSVRQLRRRWMRNFDKGAQKLAKYYTKAMMDRADGDLTAKLKKIGFSVEFKMTAAANDVMQATIGEQVGLIKSIAEKHLTEVEGLVMRSVSQGRNLSEMTKELQERYGVTKKRAALIARDQNNKATATITRVRQQELGITEAVWMHSHGGKEPRPSHVAANGKRYKIAEGMYLDGKWVWPGTEINCRCVSKSVIPGF